MYGKRDAGVYPTVSDRWTVNNTHIHKPTGNIEPPVHLSCKSLYHGKKTEHPEKTHRDANSTQISIVSNKSWTLFLYCLILRSHLSSHTRKQGRIKTSLGPGAMTYCRAPHHNNYIYSFK